MSNFIIAVLVAKSICDERGKVLTFEPHTHQLMTYYQINIPQIIILSVKMV